jgi:hypothetical protein
MHAVLFRKWNNRVKGRDFYDILWFLSLRVPLHLGYLEQKMRQGGNFTSQGPLTLAHVLELLDKRFDSLDFEEAKADVLQFVQNPLEVEAWNKEYFKGAVRGMTDSD